ncbi:hypothetical protein LN456_21495 [Xanthomonas vesicatoria]|nr:hypothetical protein [Xanthomonas vesicatoria]
MLGSICIALLPFADGRLLLHDEDDLDALALEAKAYHFAWNLLIRIRRIAGLARPGFPIVHGSAERLCLSGNQFAENGNAIRAVGCGPGAIRRAEIDDLIDTVLIQIDHLQEAYVVFLDDVIVDTEVLPKRGDLVSAP